MQIYGEGILPLHIIGESSVCLRFGFNMIFLNSSDLLIKIERLPLPGFLWMIGTLYCLL